MRDAWRRLLSHVVVSLCGAAVLVALVPLALILFYVVKQGISSLSWAFFTHMPVPSGETGGGMANAIVGSLIVTGHRRDLRHPGRRDRRRLRVRVPRHAARQRRSGSRPTRSTACRRSSSACSPTASPCCRSTTSPRLAGGFALGMMMLPLVMRTTEELLLLVPQSLREGALALGATRARAVFTVVLPAALPGIMTGVLLALARVAGETAPLLFTALNNAYFTTDPRQPISTLTVQVYTYATSPYPDWHRQAWAGALVLVTMVLTCSVLARVATARMERMQRGGIAILTPR